MIKVIHDQIISKYSKDEVMHLNYYDIVSLLAPTGNFAHNIGGNTIHSALKILVQHGTNLTNWSLKGDSLKLLRQKYKNLKLIIIGKY